jgi:hypothetical protein
MSRLMQRNLRFIKQLRKTSPKQRQRILDLSPRELLDSLGEGSYNVLKGRVKLTANKFKALRRHKQKLQTLANKRTSRRLKQHLVVQRGGFIPLLASILVPTILSLVAQ